MVTPSEKTDMNFRRHISVLRNYFDDAALKMATFKPQPEIIGVEIRLPDNRRVRTHVGGFQSPLLDLVPINEHFTRDGCNHYFPEGRILYTKDDVDRLIHDATHGRYMFISHEGIYGWLDVSVIYIPDGLLDEASHLITPNHQCMILAKNIRAIDRDESVLEVTSVKHLREIMESCL